MSGRDGWESEPVYPYDEAARLPGEEPVAVDVPTFLVLTDEQRETYQQALTDDQHAMYQRALAFAAGEYKTTQAKLDVLTRAAREAISLLDDLLSDPENSMVRNRLQAAIAMVSRG